MWSQHRVNSEIHGMISWGKTPGEIWSKPVWSWRVGFPNSINQEAPPWSLHSHNLLQISGKKFCRICTLAKHTAVINPLNAAILQCCRFMSNMRNYQEFTWIRNQYKKMTTTIDTLFLSIKAVSAIFPIVDLLQRPKVFLPEPKSYICWFIAPPCPPPPPDVTDFCW